MSPSQSVKCLMICSIWRSARSISVIADHQTGTGRRCARLVLADVSIHGELGRF